MASRVICSAEAVRRSLRLCFIFLLVIMLMMIRLFSFVWSLLVYGVWVCVSSMAFVFGLAAAGRYFMIGSEEGGIYLVYVWLIMSFGVWAWLGLLVRLVSARREDTCLLRQVDILFRISAFSLALATFASLVCLALTESDWKNIAVVVIIMVITVFYMLSRWRERGMRRNCNAQAMRELQANPISGVVEFAVPGLTFSAVSSRFQALAEHDPVIWDAGVELLECAGTESFGNIKIRRQKDSDDWVFVFADGSRRAFSPALRRLFARFHDVVFDAEWRYDLVDGFGFYRAGVMSLYPEEAAESFRASYMSTLLGSPVQFEAWLRECSADEA